MSHDEGISSYPATHEFPPPPPSGPGNADGPATSPPAPARRGTRLLKVVGVLLIGLGALSLLGAFTQLGEAPQDGRFTILLVLGVGTLAGGVHFVRHGWWAGHDVRNVVAILPPAILISMVAIGIVLGGGASRPLDDLSRLFAAASDYRLTAATVWTDYADPKVSARRWIRTVDEAMPSMETSLATLDAEVARIQDVDVRGAWEEMAALLDDELRVLVDMRSAVDGLDVRAERAAQRRLLELEREGADLIRRLLSGSGSQAP